MVTTTEEATELTEQVLELSTRTVYRVTLAVCALLSTYTLRLHA